MCTMNNRLHSKRCLVLLVGLVILIAVIASLVVFSHHATTDAGVPDPEFPLPPSSMPMGIYGQAGVVSNGGPCAQIGVDVLSKGGNAVDAIIAVMLCDSALCPEYMGMGGGFLMTIYNGTTKNVTAINARETAPAAASSQMFVKEPKSSVYGGKAIAVPGELKGFSTIYNLYGGGVSWESLFEPTIRLCEDGIEVSERLAINIKNNIAVIKNDTLLSKVFLDEKTGRGKQAGAVYKLPTLAESMRIIAKEGSNALYKGTLTARFLKDVHNIGGIITAEDMENYKVEINKSFFVQLKNGHGIHTGLPPDSGVILAYILRVLDGILPAPNAGLDAHRIVEAFKYGYAERTHLGDHRFVNVSQIIDKVKSDNYMDGIRNKISDNFTSLDPKYYGADFDVTDNHGTANLVVVDAMGNAVVATSTINSYFGCGFMSPSTGIIFNNQMDDFATPGVINYFGIEPSPANFIEPGKRPLSSMSPSIITDRNGDFVLGIGAAGGSKITLATAYVTALTLWYNKTLKEAVDKPRIYHQLLPMKVQYEYGTTRDVVQTLKDIGHPVSRLENSIGSAVTAIFKTKSGLIEAMPDFRRPGNSSGY